MHNSWMQLSDNDEVVGAHHQQPDRQRQRQRQCVLQFAILVYPRSTLHWSSNVVCTKHARKLCLFWAVFIELLCWNRKRISPWSISNFFVASGKIVWQLLEPSQMLKVLRDASRRRKEERGGESAQISCLSGAITNSRNFSNPTFSRI